MTDLRAGETALSSFSLLLLQPAPKAPQLPAHVRPGEPPLHLPFGLHFFGNDLSLLLKYVPQLRLVHLRGPWNKEQHFSLGVIGIFEGQVNLRHSHLLLFFPNLPIRARRKNALQDSFVAYPDIPFPPDALSEASHQVEVLVAVVFDEIVG